MAMILAGSGATTLLLPGRAGAYCRTTTCARLEPPPECARDVDTGCWASGIPLTWSASCVSFSVAEAGSAVLGLDNATATDIASAAFASWPNAICEDGGFPAIAVAATPSVTCDRLEYNRTGPNSNAIMFRDELWPHDSSIVALTTVTFNSRTGEILDADMEINSAALVAADVPFVVTHEAGHFFGLDHSLDETAVMYRQYAGLPTPGAAVTLAPDDVNGICAVYPPTQLLPATCTFAPAKGFAPNCGGDLTAGCSVAPPTPTSGDRRGAWSGTGTGSTADLGAPAVALLLLAALGRRRRER